ncbi:hypothetical protein ACIQ6R_06415 [Streptomyces sp. NPDC096048]|uniref:hypothetical protein n=1 Tax=Streptomyces sp. NPDC096048 TaxID=3366072 RepID=UPI0037FD0E61
MPKVQKPVDFLQRLAELEEKVARLERSTRERDEVPFYPTSFPVLAYEDNEAWTTLWETILTPRTASLALGLIFVGDQVGGVNSGGEWRVMFDDSTQVATGNVPATFTYTFPVLELSLATYRASASLKVQVQVRRTSGATTGGKYGGGGSIGASFRYARLL